jgi:hypothetical protein
MEKNGKGRKGRKHDNKTKRKISQSLKRKGAIAGGIGLAGGLGGLGYIALTKDKRKSGIGAEQVVNVKAYPVLSPVSSGKGGLTLGGVRDNKLFLSPGSDKGGLMKPTVSIPTKKNILSSAKAGVTEAATMTVEAGRQARIGFETGGLSKNSKVRKAAGGAGKILGGLKGRAVNAIKKRSK